ncbi:hypothetical protein [Rhizobium sp. NZLR4b]|uniref:hypothetical protein n=1 Tax=Rhizobium sp. NZLR4b TaxID=2731102 RepID=UPI001C83BEF3|nr:hypothetical protein [Rhizobium sp. NZLR4b]MBX5164771.1 hypothetical protein [Rhizobium sp. NZLR4b]
MHEVIRRPPLPFTPSTRGSLTDLTKKPSQFAVIAPESPRPPEMLSRVSVCEGVPDLTALDQATHEIMLSMAFETDPSMTQEVYSISLKALVRYLGRDIRKEDVSRSIKKLRQITVNFTSEDERRRYEDVRLIDMWREIEDDELTVAYSFPFPIRQLMRRMPRYAHLELAVLGDGLMSTKWGPALYKHLLLASKAREWQPGWDNDILVQMTADEIVDAVGYPRVDGKFNSTKLVDFVVKTVDDLSKVWRFQTIFDAKQDIIRETGRGRRIRYFNFRLRLNPPRPEYTRGGMISEKPGIGAKDAPEYQVASGVWEKASQLYDKRSSFHGWYPNLFRDLWLAALHEALSGEPLTERYEARHYRGTRLLDAIQRKGPSDAAWLFLGEEDRSPDLITLKSRELRLSANVARADRIKSKSKRLRKFNNKAIAAVNEKAAKPVIDVDSPFLTCRKAVLTLGDVNTSRFEAEVETPVYGRKWTGERQFLLTVTAGNNSATFRINPTADEWEQLVLGYDTISEGLSYE